MLNYAIAHLADSRDDYYEQRAGMVRDEIEKLSWLRDFDEGLESDVLRSIEDIRKFVQKIKTSQTHALIVHIPIWADPCLAVQLALEVNLPVLLLGNKRSDTSSIVGTLGAGGALDQIGHSHIRVFMNGDPADHHKVFDFISAAKAVSALRGSHLLRFGGHSLGILTAEPNVLEFMKRFGVAVDQMDQCEIIKTAEAIDPALVKKHMEWLSGHANVVIGPDFPATALEKQVRSYLAVKKLTEENEAELIAVKCQREMSDGYVCQCLTHLLMSGSEDADGRKKPVVFACESDANGALSMQILHLVSQGAPVALLDVRGLDTQNGRMIVANCGAVPEDMIRQDADRPLSGVSIVGHAFGAGKGGACSAFLKNGEVTLVRLCVKNEKIWMAAAKGSVVDLTEEEKSLIPKSFPCGAIATMLDESFLHEFGSNHLHIAYGDHLEKVKLFCAMMQIECRLW